MQPIKLNSYLQLPQLSTIEHSVLNTRHFYAYLIQNGIWLQVVRIIFNELGERAICIIMKLSCLCPRHTVLNQKRESGLSDYSTAIQLTKTNNWPFNGLVTSHSDTIANILAITYKLLTDVTGVRSASNGHSEKVCFLSTRTILVTLCYTR